MVGGSDVMVLAQHPARRQRMAATLRRAEQVIVIGNRLKAEVARFGVAEAGIEVFSRGVDRQVFSPGDRQAARIELGLPHDRPLLLWVGRMVPVKGLDVLFAAMHESSLAKLRPLLLLIGDGPEREQLEREALKLSHDSVRFIGKVPHHSLADWYRAADLMVLPSRSEGMPNVLLESLACGTGFVASHVGSIAELSSDPERELVPPGNAVALASRLVARLAEPGSRPDLAGNIPDVADSAAAMAKILRGVVEKVDNKRP
jgi:glycosyltransferase involved in cell wall biosynthesis